MKWWALTIFLGSTVAVVGEHTAGFEHKVPPTLSNSAKEMETTNDKLDEVDVHGRKIDDFITRIGYFYTYCMPKIEKIIEILGEEHQHSEHSGTLIIDDWMVAHFEELNGYMDWVIDTSSMDSIV